MSWTTPDDLKAQLLRLWNRGDLLLPLVTGEPALPLRLTLKGPGSADLTERFDAVRTWVSGLTAVPHLRIEWRAVQHRVQGTQRLPQSVWVDTLDGALALTGKRNAAAAFAEMAAIARSRKPVLLEWLAKRPLQAIDLAGQWPKLLAVVDWLCEHPRPGVYLRQADIPGVHSKFIESHQVVLRELLDLVLQTEDFVPELAGARQFAARYGFLSKPTRIRFRVLDPKIKLLPGPVCPDVALDAGSFASLDIPVRRVFITENETNLLAFPPVAEGIVVFGAGYGWEPLACATWLARCEIHYWGDIDTNGFAILDQFRAYCEHASSFLMDRATLMAHREMWGREDIQAVHDLQRLTGTERALFDDLRNNRIHEGLRLEQERVGFAWVRAAVESVIQGKI